MEGLLRKAQKLRETFVLTLDSSGKFNARLELNTVPVQADEILPDHHELPDDAGDQAEIMRQIDEVVAANRIEVTPELFTLQARSTGMRLPIIVNLTAVLLVALGIVSMYLVFNQGQQVQEKATVQLKSAEGKLIEEIKKQNQADLAAKQQEIASIQTQLGDIAKQRDNLAADMGAKVDARAAELKKDMEAKLADERKRLQTQGLSDEEIKKKLADFEKQKADEYNALLAAFKVQAETTRKKNEADLKAKEDQYNQSLAQVNQEREKLAADSKKREDDLRKQLEAQSAQATQASVQASKNQAALDDAALQIKKLAQSREQEKQVSNQIAGFYGSVRDLLRERKLEQSAETLRLLKDYLNSEPVAALESLKQRRDTDLFVVEALGGYIDRERKAAESGSATQVTAGQQSSTQAAEALKAQEAAAQALKDAQARYDAQIAKLQKESDAIQKKLQDQATARERILAEREKTIGEQDKALLDLGAARDTAVKQAAALGTELASLRINNDGLSATIADLEKTVAAQKAEIASQKTQLASVSGDQSQLGERLRTMEAQITELKTLNQAAAEKLASSSQELDRTKTSLESLRTLHEQVVAEGKTKDTKLSSYASDLAKLTIIANTYTGLIQSWNTYTQADKDLRQTLVAKDESSRMRETKVLLDSFLASELMRKAFPDLLDRIRAYDKAFEASGKENITLDLADQVYTVSSFDGRQQRLDYLAGQIAKASNAGLKEFYQNLSELLKTQSKD